MLPQLHNSLTALILAKSSGGDLQVFFPLLLLSLFPPIPIALTLFFLLSPSSGYNYILLLLDSFSFTPSIRRRKRRRLKINNSSSGGGSGSGRGVELMAEVAVAHHVVEVLVVKWANFTKHTMHTHNDAWVGARSSWGKTGESNNNNNNNLFFFPRLAVVAVSFSNCKSGRTIGGFLPFPFTSSKAIKMLLISRRVGGYGIIWHAAALQGRQKKPHTGVFAFLDQNCQFLCAAATDSYIFGKGDFNTCVTSMELSACLLEPTDKESSSHTHALVSCKHYILNRRRRRRRREKRLLILLLACSKARAAS